MAEREIKIFSGKQFKNPQEITLDQRDSEIWVNAVLGINIEGELPARFLTGFTPAFSLAEAIQKRTKAKCRPKVRVFIPKHISLTVNGIEEEKAKRQIEEGTRLLQLLSTKKFPTVEMLVETDKPFTPDVLQTLQQITDLFIKSADEQTLERLRASGRNRGGEQGERNALLYGAHHSFGWSDFWSPSIFDEVPPFTVINTLPPSEKPFIAIRETIKKHVLESNSTSILCEGKRFDLLIVMSSRPHYLLITDQDGQVIEPTLSDSALISCGEILDRLSQSALKAKEPWTRGNLRRARSDFESLLNTISSNTNEAKNKNLAELLVEETNQ